MRVNKLQKKSFFIGLLIIILLSYLHLSQPNSFFMGHIIISVLIWFFVLFASRTKQPLDYRFKFKAKVISFLEQDICPFCEKNSISEYRIKVGYSKANFWMAYFVLWIEYSYNRDDFITSVPICNRCKDRFLQNKLVNPSYSVLERNLGFSLGLKNPYDKSHIFIREKDYK